MASIFQLTGWPLPATDLYERYAVALSTTLSRRFSQTDPQKVCDAILAAILDISLKIDRLDDPDDLGGLLYVAALRKLRTMQRSDDARQSREHEKGSGIVAKALEEASDVGEEVGNAELLDRVFQELATNEVERTVLEHWGDSTGDLAQVLGYQALAPEEQRKLIKPIRDRLTQRLKRFLDERD